MAISFEYDSVIRGYHIYRDLGASHGETFDCVRETGNRICLVFSSFIPFAMNSGINFFVNDDRWSLRCWATGGLCDVEALGHSFSGRKKHRRDKIVSPCVSR